MEIELSLRCNFRCTYCYVPHDSYFDNELSLDEIIDVILQAKALGTGKFILLGGEPSIYPHIRELIEFLKSHHLEIEMFTNGTGITPDAEEKDAREIDQTQRHCSVAQRHPA